jgi:hypothetical protein
MPPAPAPPPEEFELKIIDPEAVNIYVLKPPDETYVAVVVAAANVSG